MSVRVEKSILRQFENVPFDLLELQLSSEKSGIPPGPVTTFENRSSKMFFLC